METRLRSGKSTSELMNLKLKLLEGKKCMVHTTNKANFESKFEKATGSKIKLHQEYSVSYRVELL